MGLFENLAGHLCKKALCPAALYFGTWEKRRVPDYLHLQGLVCSLPYLRKRALSLPGEMQQVLPFATLQ